MNLATVWIGGKKVNNQKEIINYVEYNNNYNVCVGFSIQLLWLDELLANN
jgi:hypothetical protein